jgi:hypothetical protein
VKEEELTQRTTENHKVTQRKKYYIRDILIYVYEMQGKLRSMLCGIVNLISYTRDDEW